MSPLLHAAERHLNRADNFKNILTVVLGRSRLAHALPAVRDIPGVENFLYVLARQLRDAPTTGEEAAFVAEHSSVLPIDAVARAALYRAVSDLLWEIEQPQAS